MTIRFLKPQHELYLSRVNHHGHYGFYCQIKPFESFYHSHKFGVRNLLKSVNKKVKFVINLWDILTGTYVSMQNSFLGCTQLISNCTVAISLFHQGRVYERCRNIASGLISNIETRPLSSFDQRSQIILHSLVFIFTGSLFLSF